MRWFQSPQNPTIWWKNARRNLRPPVLMERLTIESRCCKSREVIFGRVYVPTTTTRREFVLVKRSMQTFLTRGTRNWLFRLTWYFAKEKRRSRCTSNNVEWIEVRPTYHICLASTETFLLSLSGDCISDPSKCFHGLTVAFWIKFFSGRFIISSGGHSSFATGFDFYRESADGKFILILETSTQQWSLQLNNIPEVAKLVFLSSP